VDSATAVYWACAAVGYIALAFKVRDALGSPGRPMAWCVCAAIFLGSTNMFLAGPVTIASLERVTGVPNISAPLIYSNIIALCVSVLILVAYWRDPQGGPPWPVVRWWLLGGALIILTMLLLFAVGDAPVSRPVDFDTYYATTPYIREFITIYPIAYASAAIWIGVAAWRGSRQVTSPWLRRGLLIVSVGNFVGLIFGVCKLVAVTARWFGGDLDDLSSHVAPSVAGLALVIVAVGFTAPLWGTPISHYRAYRRLRPLWKSLTSATPSVAKPIPLKWWNLELRLTRRLTEIQDGRLALRAHFDPARAETAANEAARQGLSGTKREAYMEAARLQDAIDAKRDGISYSDIGDGRRQSSDEISELQWLVEVARAFAKLTPRGVGRAPEATSTTTR
jgi:hypothetical protein